MKIATSWSVESNTTTAVHDSLDDLTTQLGAAPDLLIAYTSMTHEPAEIRSRVTARLPTAVLHGGSSCLGAMTGAGFHSNDGTGIALWGVSDPAGSYGVGAVRIPDTADGAQTAGREAILAAIADAGRMGEPPDLIWLTAVPGHEEAILQGIQDVVGRNVPITGGSSADNTVSGDWFQFSTAGVFANAVVVTAMYPSVRTHYAFHSGYSLTQTTGTVTRANGRTLYEIDHQPAARVYNEWTNGALDGVVDTGGNVLSMTTLFPLGRRVPTADDLPLHRLAHPDSVTPDGALTLFANVEEGENMVLMAGTRESLVSRAGRVAQSALTAGRISADDISGALVVYCAGCMLTVQRDMDAVAETLRTALHDRPFVGTFTFGEQGCFVGGNNHHGNLMISVVVFEKE